MTLIEAIKQLRELNESVPKPMRLPTADEVGKTEKDLGISFHPDFRLYLLQASDVVFGTKEPVTLTDAESHTYMPTVCEEAWEGMELPKKLLPICEDNGDYYCMNKKGEVIFWSGETTDEKWKDLATWIEEVWIGEDAE